LEAVRRRILLITPFAPVRDGRHGSLRAVHGLATALAERHDLALLHTEGDQAMDPQLAERCSLVESIAVTRRGPLSRRLRNGLDLLQGRSLWAGELEVAKLTQRARELTTVFAPDVLQVEHGVVGDALMAATADQRRIVTIYDPAATRGESLPLTHEGLPLTHRLDARTSLRQERRVLSLADAAVVFTERDRALLSGVAPPSTDVVTIALGYEPPQRALDPCGTTPPRILFVGNFIHPPNIDAALRLAQRILPRVREQRPEVRLEVVGGSPPPEVRALASHSVSVAGDVPSVTPYLDRAAVVAIPIQIGGGTRVKVLEALAAGKPVVASARAAEGITAKPGEELIVADREVDMASAICRLLADEGARRRMAERARAWAERELGFSAMADGYDELYAQIDRRRARTYASSKRGTTAAGA
jgi:glycosyltransferase involved in cell wall biosynthesis